MRVAFAAPLPFALAFGGLELQMRRTAEALAGLGVRVEWLDPWKRDFEADLLHCFSSEYQLGELVRRARHVGIPIVVSSVFLPRRSMVWYRCWKPVDRLLPMQTSFGLRRSILAAADAVIALTRAEAGMLRRIFGVDSARVTVIPNGVDPRFFDASPVPFENRYGLTAFVLCVGSVEPRKNQLRLLQALDAADRPVVLIGPPGGDAGYAAAVRERIRTRPGWRWIEGLPEDSPLLASAYRAATVHALPSLTEGLPLAALEAAAAGANLVLAGLPSLRDAFGPRAWYCSPTSVASIRRAVLDATGAPRGARDPDPRAWVLSWVEVARRIREVYARVVGQRASRAPASTPHATGGPTPARGPT